MLRPVVLAMTSLPPQLRARFILGGNPRIHKQNLDSVKT
ncbi:hypothetical protein HFN_0432 [Helicobacter fennelliae MRY12-0050]|uniref:Uncharacterized protein n=1 Tax=Helicobacter fennelliae MRY12-0050 TaxID=1325130 RepID=T1D245_9HELI|nr:hypothetical protein HFN_0432 [Helicobacter fennelliae MRY12-0050]